MKVIRYVAVAATVLMSLFNLPFAVEQDPGVARALAWLVTLVGVAGLAAAVGLLLRRSWGPPAVVAIGVLNLAGAVAALAGDREGGVIGLILSLTITGAGVACLRSRTPQMA